MRNTRQERGQINAIASNMPILTPQLTPPPPQNNTTQKITSLNIPQFDGNPQYLNFFISQTQKTAELCNWPEYKTISEIKTNLTGKDKDFV